MISLDFANIGYTEMHYLLSSLDRGYVATNGPQVNEIERRLKDLLGAKDVVATNSGTAALHLALIKLHIKRHDLVILPVTSFVATANAVMYVGAFPVFWDIDPDTWCLDSTKWKHYEHHNAIKAIMGVNLYGNMCDYGAFFSDIPIIEDAAQSIGSVMRRKKEPVISCHSFNGNKTITAGGGGCLSSKRLSLAKIRNLSQQAKRDDGLYNEVGYNYRMTNLSAGLALGQLQRLEEFIEKKKKYNEIYRQELYNLVEFQRPTRGCDPVWWLTACKFPRKYDIKEVQSHLSKKSIPTRRIFRPLTHSKPYYVKNSKKLFPVAEDLWRKGLCLPSGTLNTEKDIYYVCKVIKKLFK